MNVKAWAVAVALGCSASASGELRLYTEEHPPLSFVENGKLTGMAVEVVELLAQRTGEDTRIEVVPWTRGYNKVQGEANSGLFATVRTLHREPLFQWVGPIATGYTSFYARRGAGLTVSSLKDVERFAAVAVPTQWYSYEYLSGQGLKNLYAVPTPQHMVNMFKHGRMELLVASNLALDEMLAEQGMNRDEVELLFTFMSNQSYIAFSKNTDPQLVQRWQQALDELTRDGSLQRIQQRWFVGPDTMPAVLPQAPR
jgi:polar amino acid transport system substrate-binding protein